MASAPPPPTIQSLKQDFIAEQARLLSQPLAPSRAWTRANSAAARAADGSPGEAQVPQRAVEDALVRFNHRLQQHASRVYSPVATRHVAEQLEKLYLAVRDDDSALSGGADVEGGDARDSSLKLGADFGEHAMPMPMKRVGHEDVEIRADG